MKSLFQLFFKFTEFVYGIIILLLYVMPNIKKWTWEVQFQIHCPTLDANAKSRIHNITYPMIMHILDLLWKVKFLPRCIALLLSQNKWAKPSSLANFFNPKQLFTCFHNINELSLDHRECNALLQRRVPNLNLLIIYIFLCLNKNIEVQN